MITKHILSAPLTIEEMMEFKRHLFGTRVPWHARPSGNAATETTIKVPSLGGGNLATPNTGS